MVEKMSCYSLTAISFLYLCRHGIQERIFRMEYVSNSPFVETEFNKWVVEVRQETLNYKIEQI